MAGYGRSYVRPPAGTPRLLLLTPDFPPAHGGIQRLSHRLAAGMERFHTRVLTLDAPGARAWDGASQIPTRRVRAGGEGRVRAARNLALNGAALREALVFRPRATLSMHVVTSPAAAFLARALGASTVQYFHAKEIPRRARLTAFAARQAGVSIAVSAYTAELIASAGAGGADVRLIPPGVDLPPERPDPTPPTGRPTFVTIARLEDRHKGHDVLIDALPLVRAQVPDAEWVVIGDGPLRDELEGRARAAGVAEVVRFLGALDDRRRDEWLRRAHLLAMPSRLPGPGRAGEGFGIVFLEAAAHGRPVVAGNVGGALDAVADGDSGLLVDPTDPRAVADAIALLLRDRALAHRLGEGAARRARDYAWPAIAARVEEVLLEQLDQPPVAPRRLLAGSGRGGRA